MGVIEQGFVKSVLQRLGEDFGVVLLVRCVVTGKTVESMDAHEAARSF